jgi:hypothetical protein
VRRERGSGLVGTTVGVVAFSALLLLVVQLLADLHASSALAAAAHEGANAVARTPLGGVGADPAEGGARAAAEARLRQRLGPWGAQVRLDWSASDADSVVLRVEAPPPAVLPAALASPLGVGALERTVRVRRERWR